MPNPLIEAFKLSLTKPKTNNLSLAQLRSVIIANKASHTPEAEAKRANSQRRARQRPEVHKKHEEYHKSPKGKEAAIRRGIISTDANRRPESRQRHREDTTARWQNPEYHDRVAAAIAASKRTPKSRQHHSELSLGQWQDPVIAEKHRKSALASWQDPDIIRRRLEGMHRKPTKLELKFTSFLREYFPGEWKYIGNSTVWFDKCNPDYININGRKKLIELNGCYFHCCPICGIDSNHYGYTAEEARVDEKDRIAIYKKYGFDTLIVWEHELQDKQAVVKKIKVWEEEIRGLSSK